MPRHLQLRLQGTTRRHEMVHAWWCQNVRESRRLSCITLRPELPGYIKRTQIPTGSLRHPPADIGWVLIASESLVVYPSQSALRAILRGRGSIGRILINDERSIYLMRGTSMAGMTWRQLLGIYGPVTVRLRVCRAHSYSSWLCREGMPA